MGIRWSKRKRREFNEGILTVAKTEQIARDLNSTKPPTDMDFEFIHARVTRKIATNSSMDLPKSRLRKICRYAALRIREEAQKGKGSVEMYTSCQTSKEDIIELINKLKEAGYTVTIGPANKYVSRNMEVITIKWTDKL